MTKDMYKPGQKKLLVFNVPYEDGGGVKTRGGAKDAPKAIQQEIERWSWRLSEDGQEVNFVFCDVNGEGTQLLLNVAESVRMALNRGERKICVVMGDNSVSFYSGYGLWQYEPNYGLVLFDRHPDCSPSITRDGTPKDPHACWLSALVGHFGFMQLLDPEKVACLGIGDAEVEELEFIKRHNISCLPISQLRSASQGLIASSVRQKLLDCKAVQIVIDIDVMTASEVPATGVPRGGGLTSGQMIDCIKIVKRVIEGLKIKTVVWNVGEARLDPQRDPGRITIINTASLLYEIAAD